MRFEQIEINIIGDSVQLCQDDPMEDHPAVIAFSVYQGELVKASIESLIKAAP